ncbi:MAG TPA: hypothetical protein VFF06_11195 [Polyangia bacterium]|nr:hypothetical protein [Polyangia bacterium]
MITVEQRVGRLVEVRFVSPLTDEEIAAFGQRRGNVVRSVGDRVVCLDSTRLRVLPPEHSERMLAVLRQPSPGHNRSAFLLAPGRAVIALQFERLIREAKRTTSRTFSDRAPLEAWLGEVLDLSEQIRLRQFLDETARLPE